MVQIIGDEVKAGTRERIEFYVWRSATGNARGQWQHSREEADRNASIMSSRPFTPIEQEFRRCIAWAEESEVPFVWVNDPHGLFPPSTRDLGIPTIKLRPKPGSRDKGAAPVSQRAIINHCHRKCNRREPNDLSRCLTYRRNKIARLRMRQTCKIVGAVFATALVATPIAATAQVSIDVTVAPPAPRYEVVPPSRPGYAWAPGYWNWNGGQWGWSGGRWIAARPGYHWVRTTWVRNGPRWHYVPGHWVR